MRKAISLLACGIIVSYNSFTQNNWILQNPPDPKPPFRSAHAMATIGNGSVILFGGLEGTPKNDTWVYSTGTNKWQAMTPVIKPSPRSGHSMAAFSSKEILLFGGLEAGSVSRETWLYNAGDNTWKLIPTTTNPPAVIFAAMAYAGDDHLLFFGGVARSGKVNDTWLYDVSENTWTLLQPAVKPTKRNRHAMAYIGDDKVLMFGGLDSAGNNNNETWVFDVSENKWTPRNPFNKPSARHSFAMADIEGDRALLFGGATTATGDQLSDQTWVYDFSDNKWIQRAPPTKPSARFNHRIASTAEGQIVLFGGNTLVDSNGVNGETWVFDPGTPVSIVCPANINKTTPSSQCAATISFSANATGIPTPTISYKAGAVITSPHTFPIGTTTVTATATNSVGDVATCTFTVTVKDNRPPVFICPGDTVLVATTPEGAKFTFNHPTATDNCSAIVTQIAGPLSNARFPVGVTTISFLARDPSGNRDTCSYNVTVVASGRMAGAGVKKNFNPAPDHFVSIDNYPNPFTTTTMIEYSIEKEAQVELCIYNSIGQKVHQLVNRKTNAGIHRIVFDAGMLPKGIYMYRLQVNIKDEKPIVVLKKMMLTKN